MNTHEEFWCPTHGRMEIRPENVDMRFLRCRHCQRPGYVVCRGLAHKCDVRAGYCRYHGCNIAGDPFSGLDDAGFSAAYGLSPLPAEDAAAASMDADQAVADAVRRGIF